MSADTLFFVMLSAWFGVAIVSAGIYREVTGRWDNDEVLSPMFVCAMWPLALLIAVVLGAGWCLLWLGRGPVRIVRCRRERDRLPRAEVRW